MNNKFQLINFLLEDLLPSFKYGFVLKKVLEHPNLDLLELFPNLLQNDKTASLIFDKNEVGKFKFIAKESGVIFGLNLAVEIFQLLDPKVEVVFLVKDGQEVVKNQELLNLKGLVLPLLIAERTALNLITHLSGVATKTNFLVQKIKNTKAKLLDTRKTLPGLRFWQKQAVVAGGGQNHRFGLFDAVMIKDNHIDACGSLTKAVLKIKKGLQNQPKIPIICEVRNLDELKEVLEIGVDRILLDNMSLNDLKQAVLLTNQKIPLEVSGDINQDNILQKATTGVDFISVGGSLTMIVSRIDISMVSCIS